MSDAIRLNLHYDFEHKEFRIEFSSPAEASEYQRYNPEARILKGMDRIAWLPVPKELRSFRSSGRSTVLLFETEEARSEWRDKMPETRLTTIRGRELGYPLHIDGTSSRHHQGDNSRYNPETSFRSASEGNVQNTLEGYPPNVSKSRARSVPGRSAMVATAQDTPESNERRASEGNRRTRNARADDTEEVPR
ncbi:hypothetical protein F4821DRAFT_229022 [Hypoxylon rubiginosum]|uniref:Uncharacterized protein n=1 Tax=Hypoxylon rubiginosum TaxID=110542 RepID=A0ACC0DC27_9PEZI|nr:hypothetical protein F4821DRAFT_229022 [Hypoxylon rubiginosum]